VIEHDQVAEIVHRSVESLSLVGITAGMIQYIEGRVWKACMEAVTLDRKGREHGDWKDAAVER